MKDISIPDMDCGRVYWFTGLSGAGKTTLARAFYDELRKVKPFCLFLDGDNLREVFGSDLGYSIEDRRASASRNAKLCRLLSLQGADVICATISMFHEVRGWNRIHIPKYTEIYIKVSREMLMKRDAKGLYREALDGHQTDMVGLDLVAEEPRNPDIVIENDELRSLTSIMDELCNTLIHGERQHTISSERYSTC